MLDGGRLRAFQWKEQENEDGKKNVLLLQRGCGVWEWQFINSREEVSGFIQEVLSSGSDGELQEWDASFYEPQRDA